MPTQLYVVVDIEIVFRRHALLEKDGEERHCHLSWIQIPTVREYVVYFLLLV